MSFRGYHVTILGSIFGFMNDEFFSLLCLLLMNNKCLIYSGHTLG